MKNNKTLIIITTIVCLLPMLLGLALYNKLPDQLPSHFNFQGEVDGYSSKNFGVFGMPAFLAAMNLFVAFALSTDPKRKNYSTAMKNLSLWIMPVMSIIINAIIYAKALGVNLPVSKIIMAFIGLLFIVIGLFLPKVKPNYTMGVKLPWTLYDDENWAKTHKLSGKIFIITGIIFIINIFLQSLVVLILAIFAPIIIPTIYSYLLYRKNKQENSDN